MRKVHSSTTTGQFRQRNSFTLLAATHRPTCGTNPGYMCPHGHGRCWLPGHPARNGFQARHAHGRQRRENAERYGGRPTQFNKCTPTTKNTKRALGPRHQGTAHNLGVRSLVSANMFCEVGIDLATSQTTNAQNIRRNYKTCTGEHGRISTTTTTTLRPNAHTHHRPTTDQMNATPTASRRDSFVPSFVHSFAHSLIHSFVRSFIRLCIRPFIRPFIRSLFIRSSICSRTHSFAHSFVQY